MNWLITFYFCLLCLSSWVHSLPVTWIELPSKGLDQPSPRCDHGFVHVKDGIFLLNGGIGPDGAFNDTFVFNSSSFMWAEVNTLQTEHFPRSGHLMWSSFSNQNSVWAYGGYNPGLDRYLDDVRVLDLSLLFSPQGFTMNRPSIPWRTLIPLSSDGLGVGPGEPVARSWTRGALYNHSNYLSVNDNNLVSNPLSISLILYGGLGSLDGNIHSLASHDLLDMWELSLNVNTTLWSPLGNYSCNNQIVTCSDSYQIQNIFPSLSSSLLNFQNFFSSNQKFYPQDFNDLLTNITIDLNNLKTSYSIDLNQTLANPPWPTNNDNNTIPITCQTTCTSQIDMNAINGPGPLEGHGMVIQNEIVYIWGGYSGTMNGLQSVGGDLYYFNTMYFFDIRTKKWSSIEAPSSTNVNLIWPSKRAYHSFTLETSASGPGRIWIYGGAYEDSSSIYYYYNDLWSYDIASSSFLPLEIHGSIPPVSWSHQAAIYNGVLYLSLGCTTSTYYSGIYALRIGTSISSNECQVFGPGSFQSFAGTEARFQIQTRQSTLFINGTQQSISWGPLLTWGTSLQFKILLVDQSARLIDGTVNEIGNGLYNVSYTLTQGSAFLMYVKLNNDDVFGSPFKITNYPSIPNIQTSTLSLSNSFNAVPGYSNSLQFDMRDSYSNLITNCSNLGSVCNDFRLNSNNISLTCLFDNVKPPRAQSRIPCEILSKNGSTAFSLIYHVPSISSLNQVYFFSVFINNQLLNGFPAFLEIIEKGITSGDLISYEYSSPISVFAAVLAVVCSWVAVILVEQIIYHKQQNRSMNKSRKNKEDTKQDKHRHRSKAPRTSIFKSLSGISNNSAFTPTLNDDSSSFYSLLLWLFLTAMAFSISIWAPFLAILSGVGFSNDISFRVDVTLIIISFIPLFICVQTGLFLLLWLIPYNKSTLFVSSVGSDSSSPSHSRNSSCFDYFGDIFFRLSVGIRLTRFTLFTAFVVALLFVVGMSCLQIMIGLSLTGPFSISTGSIHLIIIGFILYFIIIIPSFFIAFQSRHVNLRLFSPFLFGASFLIFSTLTLSSIQITYNGNTSSYSSITHSPTITSGILLTIASACSGVVAFVLVGYNVIKLKLSRSESDRMVLNLAKQLVESKRKIQSLESDIEGLNLINDVIKLGRPFVGSYFMIQYLLNQPKVQSLTDLSSSPSIDPANNNSNGNSSNGVKVISHDNHTDSKSKIEIPNEGKSSIPPQSVLNLTIPEETPITRTPILAASGNTHNHNPNTTNNAPLRSTSIVNLNISDGSFSYNSSPNVMNPLPSPVNYSNINLSAVLSNPITLEIFKDSMSKSFNLESVFYLLSSEEYDRCKYEYEARPLRSYIIENFIRTGSDQQINISSELRQRVIIKATPNIDKIFHQTLKPIHAFSQNTFKLNNDDNDDKKNDDEPLEVDQDTRLKIDRKLFHEVNSVIRLLLTNDAWKNFVQTEEFKLCATIINIPLLSKSFNSNSKITSSRERSASEAGSRMTGTVNGSGPAAGGSSVAAGGSRYQHSYQASPIVKMNQPHLLAPSSPGSLPATSLHSNEEFKNQKISSLDVEMETLEPQVQIKSQPQLESTTITTVSSD